MSKPVRGDYILRKRKTLTGFAAPSVSEYAARVRICREKPALLDLFEVDGTRREQLESARRAKSEEIEHPTHGRALLRDQIRLNEKKLVTALEDGLTPPEWYRLLNRKVFFWGRSADLASCAPLGSTWPTAKP